MEGNTQNFLKLQYLLNTMANGLLRKMFHKLWLSVNDNVEWENTASSGEFFLTGVGKKLYERSQKIQKQFLATGNINSWDLPLIIDAIKCLQGESVRLNPNSTENTPIKGLNGQFEALKKVRNELAHLPTLEIEEEKFETLWTTATSILIHLGGSQVELDKARKFNAADEESQKAQEAENKKAEELKNKGNAFFRSNLFENAIKAYSDGIMLPGIASEALAVFYSNRSIAYLKANDLQSAKEDARATITLRPGWWRGYARLAQAYVELKKYDQALHNNEIALSMSPTSHEVKESRDYCRHMIEKAKRDEHLDPMYYVDTYKEQEEMAKRQGLSINAGEIKISQMMNYQLGLAVGICGEAHKYVHGVEGQPQNFEMAAKLFSKAAAKGSAEGIYNLAMLTRDGKGVKRNITEAHALFLSAARQNPAQAILPGREELVTNVGVMEAQHSLGLSYEEGVGVPIDYVKALEWYKLALKNRCGSSGNNIALIYSCGKGVPRDQAKAILYWKASSLMGTVRAMENLAREFLANTADVDKALDWYHFAMANGSNTASWTDVQYLLDQISTRMGLNLKNFDCEGFRRNLQRELLESPLKDLVVPPKYSLENMGRLFQGMGVKVLPQPQNIDPFTDQFRLQIVLEHRQKVKIMTGPNKQNIVRAANPANLQPKDALDLVGLKSIFLKEMDIGKEDHIYDGFIIKLTIVEDAALGNPSIGLIAEDDNGNTQRIFVYNYPQKQETQETLGYGCRISIVNPYFRHMLDKKPAIRVDDPSTIFLHSKLTDKKRCRYCGQENGTIQCRKCRRVYYCSKKCSKQDLTVGKHELICMKRLNFF